MYSEVAVFTGLLYLITYGLFKLTLRWFRKSIIQSGFKEVIYDIGVMSTFIVGVGVSILALGLTAGMLIDIVF